MRYLTWTLILVISWLAMHGQPVAAKPAAVSGYFEPYEAQNDIGLGAGDILIDSKKRRLYFAYDDEILIVYPVAVGREGSAWRGNAVIGRMVDGPTWYPTADQRKRKKLPERVPPGPRNPLGDYALYLYQGGKDTLIRIHGTNNPSSIGKAVSDGCFRMRNDHISELFGLVYEGARVTVK